MFLTLTFILSVFADPASPDLIPLGEFPTHTQCGDVLPYLYFDGVCSMEVETLAPTTSPRPKRNPIYGGT